jgi:hypothetical protein
MFRATPVIVAALVLAATAVASHPSWMLDRKENLDRDRAPERIVAEYDVSSDHNFERAEIAAIDRCGGRERRYELAAPGRSIDREGILGQRALGRPAVAFSMLYRDGHSVARVVQLRSRRAGACPTPVWLLAYSSQNPLYPAPQGYRIRAVRVEAGEHSTAYAGKELLLTEEYWSPEMNPVRKLRRTYFRYAAAKRRYVPYRTELSPA